VYGGDGITPDYCVEPTTPSKFVAYLQARQAFIGFSRSYSASETSGVADIAGTGSRSGVTSGKVKLISKDFQVDDKVLSDFNAYLDSRKLKHPSEDLAANREAISRLILEEILRQVYGEGEARRRTLAWDPQVQKALSLVPRAEELLKEPQRFIAEYEAEEKAASRPQ
jgi:carboxyl-terminal processing protease